LRAARGEELSEESAARGAHYAAEDFDAVIESTVAAEIEEGVDRASLRISRAIDESGNARVD
jgi:hypothetical protein